MKQDGYLKYGIHNKLFVEWNRLYFVIRIETGLLKICLVIEDGYHLVGIFLHYSWLDSISVVISFIESFLTTENELRQIVRNTISFLPTLVNLTRPS